MQSLLAQSGSTNWFLLLKVLFAIIFFSLAGLVKLINKIREQQAKAEQERTRLRRQDDALRTGGIGPGNTPARGLQPPGPGMSVPATQQDARRKLQELAERRRRELSEIMRRAQGGAASAGGAGGMGNAGGPAEAVRPGEQAPTRRVPPVVVPGAQRQGQPRRDGARPQKRPLEAGSFGQRPQASEHELQRKREDDANRKANKDATSRREPQEAAARRAEEAELERLKATPISAAYQIAGGVHESAAPRPHGSAGATANLAGAMSRLGVVPGARPASEWRKALILGELLHAPVSMRAPDERVL